jgi:hypothetical protein
MNIGVVHEMKIRRTSKRNTLFRIQAYITARSIQMSLAPRISKPFERDPCLLASTNPETNNRMAALRPRVMPTHNNGARSYPD